MSDESHRPSDANNPSCPPSALDWVERTLGTEALLQELESRAQRRRRRRVIAGGVTAAILLSFVTWYQLPPPEAAVAASSPVQLTLPRQMVLPDGSVAEMRDGARVEVDFSGTLRRVKLLQGEAHFAVEKNPAWPFVVEAGGVEVRAVGTAFAVGVAPQGIEVVVTEGKVAVDRAAPEIVAAPSAQRTEPLAFVAAGEGTRVEPPVAVDGASPRLRVIAMDEAEVTERLSWRVPRLELSGTPLSVAVEALNRHSAVKLVIGDPSLARLQVSGIVRADQADALVNLLAANFDVTAELRGQETVLLRRSR
jgi:transmembrane sensor